MRLKEGIDTLGKPTVTNLNYLKTIHYSNLYDMMSNQGSSDKNRPSVEWPVLDKQN